VTISKLQGKYRASLSQHYPTLFAVCRESRKEVSRILGGKWIALTETVAVNLDAKRDSVVLRDRKHDFEIKMVLIRWKGFAVEVWNHGRNMEDIQPMYMVVTR
jgi:hypothetical protein